MFHLSPRAGRGRVSEASGSAAPDVMLERRRRVPGGEAPSSRPSPRTTGRRRGQSYGPS